MASSNPLPSFQRQAAATTSIAELQRLAGITVASMEAVRGNVEGPGRSDLLIERAERFAPKVGDRVRNTFGDEGSVVAIQERPAGHGPTLVVKFDNGKEMRMSVSDVLFLRSESDPFDPPDPEPVYYSYTFGFSSEEDAAKGRKIIEQTYGRIDDPEIEDETWKFTVYGWGDSDTDGRYVDEDLTKAGIEHTFDETEKEYVPDEPEYRKDEGRVSMRRLAHLQERAPTRKSADPAWMTVALTVAELYNDAMDALDLHSKPSGDEETAARVLFLKKVEKAIGSPRKQIPIEVYYELEDSNFHTANEFLEKADYFDAPYGERQDKWETERKGVKPMWDR